MFLLACRRRDIGEMGYGELRAISPLAVFCARRYVR
jgi:hypothetical protein